MKVVLLAGGFGSRLGEYTVSIPKPMVQIGNKPILWHIMNLYAKYEHTDFYIALGYKGNVIKEYFLNYRIINSNFKINLSGGEINFLDSKYVDWNVNLIETGLNSMTGGRLKHMKDHIGNETFFLTYGDGLADININKLLSFHKSHGKMVTITAVRPNARFGELKLTNNLVNKFVEKPQIDKGWINGGFFVIEPEFFDLIQSESTVLEKDPLEQVANKGELMAYKHEGFWQCMDTKRDKDYLNQLWDQGKIN